MSIETEVNQLLATFKNVYFNNYRASLLISKNPISQFGYLKVSEENKVDLEDTLSGSIDIRIGYGGDDTNIIIEVWLGDGVVGHYFKKTQNLIPVPWGIAELLKEIFDDLVNNEGN